MKFITMIICIALSNTITCSQDFGDTLSRRTANTSYVRPQSESSIYLSTFNTQQSLKKSQTFQAETNSQQNNVSSYHVQRPSLLYTPPKISYSVCEQPFFKSYYTSKSSNQQYSSICAPQRFKDSTSYNPQLNRHSSTFSPLNIPKSSSNHLSSQPPLFPSTSVRPLRSTFRTSKQSSLGGETKGGNKDISGFEKSASSSGNVDLNGQSMISLAHIGADVIVNPNVNFATRSRSTNVIDRSSGPSKPATSRSLRATGFSEPSEISTFSGSSGVLGSALRLSKFSREPDQPSITNKKLFSSFVTPSEIGVNTSHTATMQALPQTPENKTDISSIVYQQSNPNAYLLAFNKQQPLEKFRSFQISNYQQKDIINDTMQQPSSLYTPLNISFSAFRQPSSMLYSTSRSNRQSSIHVPQSFQNSTSYNPQSNQLSILLPLNCSKSSSTCLTSQPLRFSLPGAKPSHSASRTGKQLVITNPTDEISDNENVNFVSFSADAFINPNIQIATAGQALELSGSSSGPIGPPGTLGFSGIFGLSQPSESSRPSEFSGPTDLPSTATRRPPFITQSEIGMNVVPNVVTTQAGPRIPDIEISVPITGIEETPADFNHPPHIHSIDIECSKTMMTIYIEFNRVFNGIIYSKGYYTDPECIYVQQNSGSTRYSFSVNLYSCGTQFINDFADAGGQAYLENVLVLQNEPDVQEVWDIVRRVRCYWEGNINKALTVNLSVDMLNQEIIAFSGDTAVAKLEIQIGKGPFAPAANGLIKIGETMTLVISVEGDPDFDLQVRNCLARDEFSTNILQLTDERGCILRPKLFGAFQKIKNTANIGASVIAYAFFHAFKFPDVMGLLIECNVELCKTNCEPCPEANQQIEPGRRRRSLTYAAPSNNLTNSVLLSDAVRVGQRFNVIMIDDLSVASSQILNSMEETALRAMTNAKKVCMSNNGFYIIFSLTSATLFIAILSTVVLYVKLRRIYKPKFINS